MKQIGLIAMSAKPMHVGHMHLIEMASSENDVVELFVGASNRKRPGEYPILWTDMHEIWTKHLEPIIPANVNITYTPTSPVGYVYSYLGEANENGSSDTFTIYSDPTDIRNSFPLRSLEKYLGNLCKNNQILLRPISRRETINVSGTDMRRWLQDGDAASFIDHLPPGVDGDDIWRILKKD